MITIKKVSEQSTWASIQNDVNDGKAKEYKIGTVVVETLKDGRKMPYTLVAINHYQPDELIFVNLESYGNHCMNEIDTNEGGWQKSELRRYANEDIYALLPDEMAAVITPRLIVETTNDGTKVETDKLWCLSMAEVCGIGEKIDKQFPYFKDDRNRLFTNMGGLRDWWERTEYDESQCGWWLRSLPVNSLISFHAVSRHGYAFDLSSYASRQRAVRLGFCIRKKCETNSEEAL